MSSKTIVLVVALATPVREYAQTQIDQTIPVAAGQTIVMLFDYPELVRVSTWDKNEINVRGTVSINGGENDDAFLLEHTTRGNAIHLDATIKDLKKLPQRITVMREGQKIMFRDESEWKKYRSQHGGGYNSMSWGPDIEIALEVRVPRNTGTEVTSVYGMVEVRNFSGPLTVSATYGGVDASLLERAVGELTAETNYGEIFTNLDIEFKGDDTRQTDFYTFVTAKPGTGPRYSFESKYGNVYLRKAGAN